MRFVKDRMMMIIMRIKMLMMIGFIGVYHTKCDDDNDAGEDDYR